MKEKKWKYIHASLLTKCESTINHLVKKVKQTKTDWKCILLRREHLVKKKQTWKRLEVFVDKKKDETRNVLKVSVMDKKELVENKR